MRFIATLLTTAVAVLVISATRPALSGGAAMPPCEVAPQVPATTTPKPAPPTNLRIIKSVEALLEDVFAGGPHAGAEADAGGALTAAASAGDPNAYYFALASRSDCFAAYSLRDDNEVLQYSSPKTGPRDLTYIYPNDPDPRRQDAMLVLTRADMRSPIQNLRLPLGAHHPKNLLVVEERWWGAEFNYNNTSIGIYKGDPYFESGKDSTWLAVRTEPLTATQHTQNLPPGGPYVLMLNPQSLNGSQIKDPFYRGINPAYPPLRLPYTAPSKEQRNYGEGVAPRDTSAGPAGAEFGVVAERWTRIWHFFERAPEEDWESTESPAGPRIAYRWTMWAADTQRDPIRIINGAIASIYPGSNGLTWWRMHIGVGNGYQEIPPGRGPLVAYARNIVVLHGIAKADVLKLLTRPVN
jgi:hypothetical protein